MSNTIRIRTTPNGGDKYLKIKLEQDFDFIEILSLKISQEDTYRKFCSDYGTIVGRVSVNNGFGVPNAKVSVFIPLDDIDKNDPLIKGLYPFEVVTDKNDDGVRYNLFPKDADPSNECSTPIGTFPSKREVLDNDTLLNIYCKYYKFTTTTNHAGDFMLFGVPLGTYTVHVDADISNIGIASQRPYDLISQGTPEKMFYSPTKFNADKNLDKLIQVKTMNTGVNVQPFWGDPENCEIGISRLDFDLNYSVRPAAIFMGSIYGDQDKHSINGRCRPRFKLGLLCDQVAGPGSINMIRKTFDGQIEEFNVEGGRVIDNDGAWAYQIPMNLDYMVTDEVGNLILSQDPNKGIATRARVRFNIGMDETGGEGRLRTRARYLVPNNPTTPSDIDYTFGSDTKDHSFRDLYWNKIYSVSNYISRFQRANNIFPVKSRSMTAIKNVDACAGDKTPFPYNRVNTELNPIFFIICLIIKIIAFLIWVMNKIFIPIINFMIDAINTVMNLIVSVINAVTSAINSITSAINSIIDFGIDPIASVVWTDIPHVGCITVTCPSEEGQAFAPGCSSSSSGFAAANPAPIYFPGDTFSHGTGFGDAAGLDDCIAFEMAKTLDMFQFDFYNDWVNGSLFGYLLKYKKRRRGREVFCEYDCSNIAGGGVDGNHNNIADNDCQNNLLLDTCFDGGSNNNQAESREIAITEGLIKKIGNDFFYAATTHDTNYKLFATDIINLGSVFECDWQGIPKINNALIPTTYKIPPDVQELNDAKTVIEACGMVSIGSSIGGLFFTINCLGLHVDKRQCLNIRHICEMGVEIDQAQEDPATGVILIPSDCIIGSNDIDDNNGQFFRDVFFGLNNSATPWVGLNNLIIPPSGYGTDFNLQNCGNYDFTSIGSYPPFCLGQNNDINYIDFRGYSTNESLYGQTKHSYFFYFGLLPGKTGLDKMNKRFFTHCIPITRDDIIMQTSSTPTSASTGTITFTFIGGTGPFTYTITGVNGTSYGPVSGTAPLSNTVTLTGLPAGTYLIDAFDSLGTPVSRTVIVAGPPPFYCSVAVTKNATAAGVNDGEITILSVGGGSNSYTYEVINGGGSTITGPISLVTTPLILTNLAVDSVGYTVKIKDTSVPVSACTTTGLTIGGPSSIIVTPVTTNVTCYGGNNGSIVLNITGGQPPFIINTTKTGFSSSSQNMTGLQAGTYVTTILDSLSTTASVTNIITQPPQLGLTMALASDIAKQCNPSQYEIPFLYGTGAIPSQLAGITPLLVEYQIDSGTWTNYPTPIYLNVSNPTTTPMYVIITSVVSTNVKIRFKDTTPCYSNVLTINKANMALPPATLAVTPNTQQQCSVGSANLSISINNAIRAPFTVNYTINGVGQPSFTTSTSTTNWTRPVSSPSVAIVYTITDNKGCIATASQTVITPASVLTVNGTRTGPVSGVYTYSVTSPTGGIPPYTYDQAYPYTTASSTHTIIITDSNGCVATKVLP